MTALGSSGPGLAGGDTDAYTQSNTILAGVAPTKTSYGVCFSALAANTLVGRVTETGELVASAAAAADGSQNPIGVTTHAADPDADSNSALDSNSVAGDNSGAKVGFYTDGVFNFDMLVMGAGWTLESLRRNLELNGQSIGVDVIQTATPSVPA